MIDYNSPFKIVGGNEGKKCNHNRRLDTYGCGCLHNCKYCYAKSLLDFRNKWNPDRPAVANISDISKAVKKLSRKEVIRLGGMTDCFQPIELLYRNTYKTIMLLNRRKVPYLIVTKSALVANDEYMNIMDKKLAHIQISITTHDDELARGYENASPPSERIKAIKKLQEAGFDVQLRLSPYIPEYVDLSHFTGIDKVLVEFLRVNNWIKKWFDIDYSDYSLSQNGYQHLPLERKKQLIKKVKGFKELSVCEDEDEAFTYWQNNVNYNKDDCCNLRR